MYCYIPYITICSLALVLPRPHVRRPIDHAGSLHLLLLYLRCVFYACAVLSQFLKRLASGSGTPNVEASQNADYDIHHLENYNINH